MEDGTKEVRSLFCVLTDKDLLEKGKESADLIGERNALESEKKGVADTYKSKIQIIETRVNELSTQIKNKQELRQVDCEWKDGDGKIVLYRKDTGEVVEERELDKQKKMEL